MAEKMNIVEAVNAALHDEMESDDDVVVLGEDVGKDGGVFRATKELQENFGRERCFSTPLAESGIVGTSIGMALHGQRPVPEIQFSGFSYLAFHQIKEHAARFRTRTRGGKDVPMTVRAPYGGGINALEHHCESPENFFSHAQGLHVVIPSSPQETYSLLRKSIQLDDPVVFLEPKQTYRAFKEKVERDASKAELEEAKVVAEGEELTVVCYGAMVPLVKGVAKKLEASVEIIDLRTVYPTDFETVVSSAEKTGRAAVVHEAPRTGGFGAEIAAKIQEEAILKMEAPVERITAPDVPYPLYRLEDYYMPDENQVQQGLQTALEF